MINEVEAFNSWWAQNDVILESNLNQYLKKLITNGFSHKIYMK